ncbi:MAG TPA: two-component regulator propeller domain-containing protein [Chitinophagaceae bacterium]|nr:two-component regulator propeller domain-containing protein [Chitinophagaceae bacterium]
MRKSTLPLLFLIMLCLSSAAQSLQYTFAHYGENDGLAGVNVQALAQDPTGFIWIGTESGLQRYDGSRYLSFYTDSNRRGSLLNNNIRSIQPDGSDFLWLCFNNGSLGLFQIRTQQYTEIPVQSSDNAVLRTPKNLRIDSKGNAFFVCNNQLFVYSRQRGDKAFMANSNYILLPPNRTIYTIVEDQFSGKYWIGTDSGLAVYNSRTRQLSTSANNAEKENVLDEFRDITYAGTLFIDAQRRLWVLNWPPTQGASSIHLYNLAKNKTELRNYSLIPVLRSYHEILGLTEQRNGDIWIFGSSVLARFNETKKVFVPVQNGYQHEFGIAFDGINTVYEDRESNLWIGTDNNGLYRFNPSQQYFKNVRVLNRQNGEPGKGAVMSFQYDNDGSILVGTWSDGLYRYDAQFNNRPLGIRGIPEKNSLFAWCMTRSRDNRTIYIGAQPGLYLYDTRTRSAEYYSPAPLQKRTIRQITEDNNGNLWLGMHNFGLFKWTKDDNKPLNENNIVRIEGVPVKLVTSIAKAGNGYIWVGFQDDGVYVIDPETNKVVMHLHSDGRSGEKIMDDHIASIIAFDENRVIVAAGGINVYDISKGTLRAIKLPRDLSPSMASMEKGTDGHLWVSFASGLCRVNLDQQIFIHFYKIDGIINDHFQLASSRALPDGRMLFGSSNQFVVFNPREVSVNFPAPGVVITDIEVMNKSLLVDSVLDKGKLELEEKNNSLGISFSGLNYNGAYLILYKMEGLDDAWKVAGKENQAVYNYLPPGSYTFRAKSQDSEGNYGPLSAKLQIKIKPPFWQTWWFASLLLFAALGLLFWLDKLRTQKIRATESIRTRIATSLTEDMSNSLSSINISSELAKIKIDTDTERTREYINQISDTSNRMVQSMYDMVWSINPENDSMRQSIDRMKSFANELETMQQIDIVFDIDKNVVDPHIDMEHRYELMSIFKEALINAAKHSGGRHIQVSIRYKKPRLILSIQDDGKGFDVDAAELGRGISDMRRRAAAIHADLIIHSEINTGSMVRMTMKVISDK